MSKRLPRLHTNALAKVSQARAPDDQSTGQLMAFRRPQNAARGRSSTAGAPATASTADIYLFGRIGGFGVTARDFVRDVAPLDVEQLVLHLNTPGGDALEGVAIANVLRAHKARVIVRVDGLAASAGSVVAMAGDEVVMGIGSQFMIHDPWTITMGDASEMEACAQMLHTCARSLASTLAAKAGGTADQWREVMRTESWYTADEAVAANLADRVAAADETGTAEGEQITPGGRGWFWDIWDCAAEETFDLSEFATYAGREQAPEPLMPGRQTPAALAAGTPTPGRSRDVAFSDEQLSTLRQWLNLAADADETAITAALVAATEPAEADGSGTGTNGGAPTENHAQDHGQSAAEAGDFTPPPGTRLMSEANYQELLTQVQRGVDAAERQEREDRERLVDAAIGDGRITAAEREDWLKAVSESPTARTVLSKLAKNHALPVTPLGHDGAGVSNDDNSPAAIRESDAYKNWSM